MASRRVEEEKRKRKRAGTKREEKIEKKVEASISQFHPITSKTPRAVREHLEQTTPKRPGFTPAEKPLPPGTTKETVGKEEVETRIVSKEEALRVAEEAGGVPPPPEDVGVTIAGKEAGLGKIAATILTPFAKERIGIHTDNRVFNTALEYVANNPYATGLMLYGAGKLFGLAKGAIAGAGARQTARFAVGKAISPYSALGPQQGISGALRFATNTKSATQSVSLLAKTMAIMKKPAFVLSVIGASVGTYPWAEWSTGEAMEIMGFATNNAIKLGDPELIREVREQAEEIYDPALWEQIARLIPLANIAAGFRKKTKALLIQKEVNDRRMAAELKKSEEKPTAAESQENIDAREAAIRRGR